MRPSFLIYGIDLVGLRDVQDVLMIEDFRLPRWETRSNKAPLLVNNALTLHTATAIAAGRPVSTDPYDQGIGFDNVYPPRRFCQGMAEAAACGVPMVVKGTEFVENGRFTLLTSDAFGSQRQAIGRYHRWLAEHTAKYAARANAAAIGLLYPGEALWQEWARLAPLYFGAGQTLLAAGLPWRVVAQAEQLPGLQTLLTFGPAAFSLPASLKTVKVSELLGWETPRPSFLSRQDWLQRGLSPLVTEIYRAYFRFRWARWLLERLGLVRFLLQSPYFVLPPQAAQHALSAAVEAVVTPRMQSEAPALIEHGRQGNQEQVHLVNYAGRPQPVHVNFWRTVRGRVLSPDQPDSDFDGMRLDLTLDVYTLVLYDQGAQLP